MKATTPTRQPVAGRRPAPVKAAASMAGLSLLAAGITAVIPTSAVAVPATSVTALAPSSVSAAAALAAPAAVQAASVTTPFKWSNGKAVNATVVSMKGAATKKASSLKAYSLAAQPWGLESYISAALPDGRFVGTKGYAVKVQGKDGKLHNYFAGPAPTAWWAEVQGSTVLGLENIGFAYKVRVYTGPGKKPGPVTTLKGDLGGDAVVLFKGRMYFSLMRTTSDGNRTSDLYSTAVGGSVKRLEARNASDARLGGGGLIYSQYNPKGDPELGAEMLAVKSLAGHKTLVRFPARVSGSSLQTQESASGNLVTVDYWQKKGLLVMDVVTKKAWLLQFPDGYIGGLSAVGPDRVAWTVQSRAYDPKLNPRKVFTFNAKTGKATVYTTNNPASAVVLNGDAMKFTTDLWGGFGNSVGGGLLR